MKKDFSVTLIQSPFWCRETPPLAISLLAGNLRDKGFKVNLFDLNNECFHFVSETYRKLWIQGEYTFWSSEESVKELMEKYHENIDDQISIILETGSRLIGFSIYYTTICYTMELARQLKERSRNTIIVLGGPSTVEYGGGMELLRKPQIDALVLREGDITLPEMCTVIMEKGNLDKIPGIVFKKDDQIIHGGLRTPVSSLDELPFPDYSDFNLTQYNMPGRLNTSSSRGCINKCYYCGERDYFGRFRFRSGKSLFKEVLYQQSRHPEVKFINFNDSIFNASPKSLREFSELIINNNISVVWGGQAIISESMTPELLGLMARAGCIYIGYGIESGSEAVRKSMNKAFFSNEIASRVIKDTHEAGIGAQANFMFGYPTESEQDFQMTLDFVRQNSKWLSQVNPSSFFTILLPNTYLYKNREEFGIVSDGDDLFWETKDRKNTYPIRLDRYERFCKLCFELNIPGPEVTEEKVDKWKLLGAYYRFKKDYVKAIECNTNDLMNNGYSKVTVESFLENIKDENELDIPTILKDVDLLILRSGNVMKPIKDQIIEIKGKDCEY